MRQGLGKGGCPEVKGSTWCSGNGGGGCTEGRRTQEGWCRIPLHKCGLECPTLLELTSEGEPRNPSLQKSHLGAAIASSKGLELP